MNTKEFKTYADKEKFVQGVFSNIAKNYDLMNTVLSFGQDYFWRKFSVIAMNIGPHQYVLDVHVVLVYLRRKHYVKSPL